MMRPTPLRSESRRNTGGCSGIRRCVCRSPSRSPGRAARALLRATRTRLPTRCFPSERRNRESRAQVPSASRYSSIRDLVARLLTSRPHGRPETPPCQHGHPYPSFYLGVLGNPLSAKSSVDLRYLDDFDEFEFRRHLTTGRISPITSLTKEMLPGLLDCAAAAKDTTRLQERAIRDALAKLR